MRAWPRDEVDAGLANKESVDRFFVGEHEGLESSSREPQPVVEDDETLSALLAIVWRSYPAGIAAGDATHARSNSGYGSCRHRWQTARGTPPNKAATRWPLEGEVLDFDVAAPQKHRTA